MQVRKHNLFHPLKLFKTTDVLGDYSLRESLVLWVHVFLLTIEWKENI
jgi:hypothetical protein